VNISPLDIKQKQFKLELRGFDKNEVDSFLEEITTEMEKLVRENEFLKEEKANLDALVLDYRQSEKSLRDALMSANKMAEDMKSASERDYQLKIKEAEMQAEKIIMSARQQLAKIEAEIAEMNRIKERFALKIKGVIEDHLKMLSYEERQEGR
jgi:cell division initiation protein